MYDSIPLTKVTPFRGTSQVTRRKKLHPLIAALQPGASILARRVTLPLLLLTAGMVVVQPCAGQGGTWIPTGSLNVYALQFKHYRTGKLVHVLWTLRGKRPVTLDVPEGTNVAAFDLNDNEMELTRGGGKIAFTLGQSPCYVEGLTADAALALGAQAHGLPVVGMTPA